MKNYKRQISMVMALIFLITGITFNPMDGQAAVKINKKSLSIKVGKTYKLKVKGTKKKVKWSSSNKKVVTVSSKGVVKGKKAGKATVTAKVGKKKYKCKVKVTAVKKTTSSNQTPAQPTPTPVPAPTPVPTQAPSNVDTVSTDALAAGCSVKVEKLSFSGDLLFTVTNTNKQMVQSIKINYVVKDSQGKALSTDFFTLDAIGAGQSKQCAMSLSTEDREKVDVSKTEVSKTVSNDGILKYEDTSANISVSTETTEDGDIVYTMKNNGTKDAYGEINFYFYDADKKLIHVNTERLLLSANETKMETSYLPYVYNEEDDRVEMAYDKMETKVQAYTY